VSRAVTPVARCALLLPLVLFAAVDAQARTPNNRELDARTLEMEARLATVERANQGLVPMQQQIEAARSELRALRGQIEEARHELETLRQQQRDLYADLDRRLLLIEGGAAPVAPAADATGQAPTEQALRDSDETAVYGDAFAALKARRYPDAIRGFQLYLAKYPEGPRADNAAYWLGEAYFLQKEYESALKTMQDLLKRHPASPRAAQALLMVGMSQYELKAFRNARASFERVAAEHPGTESARLAAEQLARMDVERR
jgi:tol-pal system protein YbgF